ncbi:MAG: hypothetical protein IRZ33_11030, partial [Alicyclobacillaceae bacterium]|nr:hypothetical protein [Alicyclobacillaceae bacterium]
MNEQRPAGRREPEDGVPAEVPGSGPDHRCHTGSIWSCGYPSNLAELVAQVQWLAARVAELEAQMWALAHQLQLRQPTLSGVRRVQFRVGKLYVRDLSGTLN